MDRSKVGDKRERDADGQKAPNEQNQRAKQRQKERDQNLNFDAEQVTNLILQKHEKISEAITTGAAWEIWMQVELYLWLKQLTGIQVSREIRYSSESNQRFDILVATVDNHYTIELKVQSATNATLQYLSNFSNDINKIEESNKAGKKWVIGIAYSAEVHKINMEIAKAHDCYHYKNIDYFGVAIADVSDSQKAQALAENLKTRINKAHFT